MPVLIIDMPKTSLESSQYIDIHSHQRTSTNVCQILSMDTEEYNPSMTSQGYYSLGIHPWFIHRQNCVEALDKIQAAIADKDMLAIGECGLDKAIATPLPEQLAVFQIQVELAENYAKPLILHCVRAYSELQRIKKQIRPGQPWVLHGMNAQPILARQLIRQGFYLSFGQALLHENSNARQIMSEMPLDRVFLETDAAALPIASLYEAAAKIVNLEVDALQNIIIENFKQVFIHV